MSYRNFIKNKIDDKSFLAFLSLKNDWYSMLAIVLDWVSIFLAIYLAIKVNHILFDVLAIWFIGIKQYALGEVFVHEAAHKNLFKSKFLNTRLQFLFSLPLLSSVEKYRKCHIPHHAKLGDNKVDPLCDSYKKYGLSENNPSLLWIWFIRPLIGLYIFDFLKEKISETDWKTYKYALLSYILLSGICWYNGILNFFFFYWIIPYIWCFSSFYYWQEIEDHYNTKGVGRTTRGVFRNLLAHNSGYHLHHHLYPSIPWYNLPKAYRLSSRDEEDISKGFIDTYKHLRAKTSSHKKYPLCLPESKNIT